MQKRLEITEEDKEVLDIVRANIIALVEQKGISRRKLTDIAEIDNGNFSDFMTGKVTNPGSVTLIRIARALGVATGYLFEKR